MPKKQPSYKVCILAAGEGSDLGELSKHIHRAILPVNFKAVISHIVEKFSESTEFVIAVGHRKDTIQDYLKIAHPDRNFKFVTVEKYAGPGSGPGYSLLACKKYLQSPFILTTADTIVLEDVPKPDYNWIGIAPVRETERFCTVKIKNNLVYELNDKVKVDNKYAFIGLAGIKDYKEFFAALEQNKKVIANEIQISNGLQALIARELTPIGFTWFDTGSFSSYVETNKSFSGEDKFDFSKSDEFLYFVGDRVIKFFANKDITEKRHKRSQAGLKDIAPKILERRGHFYGYKKVEGDTLYNVLNEELAAEFFEWAKTHLWKRLKLTPKQKKEFEKASLEFYRDKTLKRVALFNKKIHLPQETLFINGTEVPSVEELLEQIDWNYIASGIPSNFHGDLQFDNILVTEKNKKSKDKFVLIDWRHEFGGLVHVGDLYYDLAKLYGGMTISYPLIKEGMFAHSMTGPQAYYHFFIKNDLAEARERYEEFLAQEGYDLKKIKLLTSIIFLNMAPLHNGPFDLLLYHLGRKMLYKSLAMS